jgi:hypothetical protein
MTYQTKMDKLYKKIDRLKWLIEDIQEVILMDESQIADEIKDLITEYEGEEEW